MLGVDYNGTVMTTSVKIANVFGKQHKDVLDKIKEKQSLFTQPKIRPPEINSR
ncbi:MAG: hypothetical protein ACLSX5_01675 [Lachnospiraceae bacterium]